MSVSVSVSVCVCSGHPGSPERLVLTGILGVLCTQVTVDRGRPDQHCTQREHICVFPDFLCEHEHMRRRAQRRIPAPPRRRLRARAHRHAPKHCFQNMVACISLMLRPGWRD